MTAASAEDALVPSSAAALPPGSGRFDLLGDCQRVAEATDELVRTLPTST